MRMTLLRAIGVLVVVLVLGSVSGSDVTHGSQEGCWKGLLESRTDVTPNISLSKPLTLQLHPDWAVKDLRILLVLVGDTEDLYELGLDANMGVDWGDVGVTIRNIRSQNMILKMKWPPILLPHAWTTLQMQLHRQYLLQLAMIPLEVIENPRSSVLPTLPPSPLAMSVLLERRVFALRLELLTDNISVQYSVNCGKEYLETVFASQFGIASSVPLWQMWVWILLATTVMLLVLITVLVVMLIKLRNGSLADFMGKCFKKGRTTSSVLSGSFRHKRSSPTAANSTNESLDAPSITVGAVSSRAPSPGHEVDENTFDYINQAFTG